MPKVVTPLTDKAIKSYKPKEKAYTKTDGQGLRLLIKPNNNKLWEFEYTSPTLKKRRKTSFGNYPQTTLVRARALRDENIDLIKQGIDPIDNKATTTKKAKELEQQQQDTFKKVALEWHDSYISEVSENYHNKLLRALELYIFPFIDSKPISEITRKDIIKILQDLKDKDLRETANRTLMILNKVFMYAVTLEKTPHNIIADIDKKVILGTKVTKNYPTFTKVQDIRGLLLSIDGYSGDYSTVQALKILPYVFVRSANIRQCEWSEIDFEAKLWTIPHHKMKTKKEFVLPLPNQVITILEEIQQNSFSDKYVFPSFRGKDNPMSDNTLISALRRMGYTKEEFVPHSFRSVFSTIAYEYMNISKEKGGHSLQGEVIESLLAHEEQNKVKGAYNRAEYLEAKRELIQWYADYLDEVKKGENK